MNNGMILMRKPKSMIMMYDARNGNYDAKIRTNNLLDKFSAEKMILLNEMQSAHQGGLNFGQHSTKYK